MAEAAVKAPTLAECIQRVQDVWSGIQRNDMARFEHLGRALIEVRKLVPVGKWQKFVRATFDFSPEAAHRWMKLAKAVDAEPDKRFRRMSDVNPSWGWGGGKAKARYQQARRQEEAEKMRQFHADRQERFRTMRSTGTGNEADRKLRQELHQEIVTLGYREAAKKHHPDRGGSNKTMAILTQVRDRMLRCAYCRMALS